MVIATKIALRRAMSSMMALSMITYLVIHLSELIFDVYLL